MTLQRNAGAVRRFALAMKFGAWLQSIPNKLTPAPFLMHNLEAMSRPWFERLEAGIRNGTPPFQISHGEDLFDYLDHHADMDRLFSDAMETVEALAGDGFATDFDWGRFDRIVDVGGSRGTKSLAILRHHPRLSALIVDRPQVVEQARDYCAKHPAPGADRLRFETGDLLAGIPAAAGPKDIYLLSAVLHGFDDGRSILVLRA